MTITSIAQKQLKIKLKEVALSYYDKGLYVLPLKPGDKLPYFDLLPRNDNGEPSWKLLALRRASKEEIVSWYEQDPFTNIGIITGKGFIVIDIDQKQIPQSIYQDTVIVKTGRGYHLYFKHDEQLETTSYPWGEVKGAGGYVVAPPSVHPSGEQYDFLEGFSFDDKSPAKLDLSSLTKRGGSEPFFDPSLETYKEGVRINTNTYSPMGGNVKELSRSPEVAFLVLELCGGKVDRIGKAFKCVLPGHNEKKPSAALWQKDEEGDIMYHDFHKAEGVEWLMLPDVYASTLIGKTIKLDKAERVTWWLRALHQAGILEAPTQHHYKLPKDAPAPAEKLYKGFIYLLSLRSLYDPEQDRVAPFSWNFAGRWCSMKSSKQVQQGMKWLLESGYLKMVKKGNKIGGKGGPKAALLALGKPKKK